ncbi:MAG: chlorohydrolase [Acidobacteria bacterium]|nr:MAG: chlorohydrolase [Acidobacteriota bacterium]
MSNLFIQNTTVVSSLFPHKIRFHTDVLIEDSKITSIEKLKIPPENSQCIDGSNKLLMPGLINAHTHFYSAFARGYSNIPAVHCFHDVLENLWWKLDRELTEEACYYSALIGCIEAIKAGTTTLVDHHAAPHAFGLNQVSKAVQETHLRACLCYEVSDRDGPEIAQRGIQENDFFLSRLQDNPSDTLKGLFGLHASFTLTDETLKTVSSLVDKHQTGIHIHLAEDQLDQDHAERNYRLRATHRLENAGLLNSKALLAHGVHLNQFERQLINKHACFLVHNPQSNMNNAVGAANLHAWHREGLSFGLGTDAMTYNMLEELRVAIWLQKLRGGDPSLGFVPATQALFQGNPKLAERIWGLPLGRIAEKGPADVILYNYQPYTDLSEENILGHIVFGVSQADVHSTIVNGKLLMHDGKLLGLDESEIYKHAKLLADELWKKMES